MLWTKTVPTRPSFGTGAKRTRGSRRRVIAVALGVQALLLTAGGTFTFREVRERVSAKFKDQIVASNIKTVDAVREKLADMALHGTTYGDEDWALPRTRLQPPETLSALARLAAEANPVQPET